MSTITTISAGDFERVVSAVKIGITNVVEAKEFAVDNEIGHGVHARRSAQRAMDTLGIRVVDQTDFVSTESKTIKQTRSVIARLMAAIETPKDLSEDEVKHLLEDANLIHRQFEGEQ